MVKGIRMVNQFVGSKSVVAGLTQLFNAAQGIFVRPYGKKQTSAPIWVCYLGYVRPRVSPPPARQWALLPLLRPQLFGL